MDAYLLMQLHRNWFLHRHRHVLWHFHYLWHRNCHGMFHGYRKRDMMRHLENEGRNCNQSVSHERNVYFREETRETQMFNFRDI